MKNSKDDRRLALVVAFLAGLSVSMIGPASAHCDTLDGPIVPEARAALESGDVGAVLKWVQAEDEAEIRETFEQTRKLRAMTPEVRELADRYFLETLIRVHRQGEGAPYTGLKPAGAIDPAFVAADAALASGDIDALADEISTAIHDAIHQRFTTAHARRQHASHNVHAGREYVEAYVEYIHFIEGLHGQLDGHGPESVAPAACGGHAD